MKKNFLKIFFSSILLIFIIIDLLFIIILNLSIEFVNNVNLADKINNINLVDIYNNILKNNIAEINEFENNLISEGLSQSDIDNIISNQQLNEYKNEISNKIMSKIIYNDSINNFIDEEKLRNIIIDSINNIKFEDANKLVKESIEEKINEYVPKITEKLNNYIIKYINNFNDSKFSNIKSILIKIIDITNSKIILIVNIIMLFKIIFYTLLIAYINKNIFKLSLYVLTYLSILEIFLFIIYKKFMSSILIIINSLLRKLLFMNLILIIFIIIINLIIFIINKKRQKKEILL